MIIYGWGNFNRRDHGLVRGRCRSCGRRGFLRSYTSSKFFTLYFVPLIPLGKQKIVADCSHCKKAYGMGWREWKRLHATALPQAIAAYEQHPADAEAAKTALGTIINLQDRPSLERIGPPIHRAFAQDANMLTLLAGTYSYLCQDREADALYLQAVGLSDDPAIAAEAHAHLEEQKLTPPRPHNRLLQSLPVFIVPAAIFIALATFVQRGVTARPEHAYVLNGLDRSYTVVINGESIKLAPHKRVPGFMLHYGRNTIAPSADSAFLDAQDFAIDASWYERVFGAPLFVVNPDEAAVLMWERGGYASGGAPENAYAYELATGQLCHVYRGIDFPFQPLPDTIQMPASSSIEYRTRVTDLGQRDVQNVIAMLQERGQTQAIQAYLRARLRAGDGGDTLIYVAARVLPRAEFGGLAEPHLAARPIAIAWHRAYQDVFEDTPEGGDLVARYRALVAQEPESSTLAYLLSRVVDDPDESMQILERAVKLPHPSGYAFYGRAFDRMIEGDFAGALADCDEAVRLEPAVEQFRSVRRDILYGLQQYDAVEKETGNLLKDRSPDLSAFYEHVYRLGKLGRAATGRTEIPSFLGLLPALGAAQRATATAYLESALDLAAGNRTAFAATIGRAGESSFAFEKELVAGHLDAALKLAGGADDPAGLLGHLTLYVLLAHAGRPEAAGELAQAVKALGDGTASQKRWSAWLRGDAAPDPRRAAFEIYDIDNHGVFLAALAQKFPARADDYLERARKLHYRETVHLLALADVLSL